MNTPNQMTPGEAVNAYLKKMGSGVLAPTHSDGIAQAAISADPVRKKLVEALKASRLYIALTAGQSVLLLQVDDALASAEKGAV